MVAILFQGCADRVFNAVAEGIHQENRQERAKKHSTRVEFEQQGQKVVYWVKTLGDCSYPEVNGQKVKFTKPCSQLEYQTTDFITGETTTHHLNF